MPSWMAVLDARRIETLRKDVGEDGISEIAEVLYREGPKRVEEMRTALAAGDRATLERAAHSLKSNARLFGATALADRCRELEESSRASIPADASSRVDEVGRLYSEADAAIRAALSEP